MENNLNTNLNNNNKVKIKRKISKKYQEIDEKHYKRLVSLGSAIKKKRLKLNISIVEFAKMMNVSRLLIYSLEEGIPNVSLYYYYIACELLDIELEFRLTNIKKDVENNDNNSENNDNK